MTYLLAGGDKRLDILSNMLSKENKVYRISDEHPETKNLMINKLTDLNQLNCKIDVIILPIVATRDGKHIDNSLGNPYKILITDILKIAKKFNSLILAGNPTFELSQLFKNNDIELIDYFNNERLLILNAVATAEGSLQLIMHHSDKTIFGSKCLITGYGRLSKIIAKYLKTMGAEITILARSESQLTWAEIEGYYVKHINDLEENLNSIEIIINTIPSIIIPNNVIDQLNKNIYILDISSNPGGLDHQYAKSKGLKTNLALGIPGKYSPKSATEYIYNSIQNLISERG